MADWCYLQPQTFFSVVAAILIFAKPRREEKATIFINLLLNYLPNLIFKDRRKLFLRQQMIRWREQNAIFVKIILIVLKWIKRQNIMQKFILCPELFLWVPIGASKSFKVLNQLFWTLVFLLCYFWDPSGRKWQEWHKMDGKERSRKEEKLVPRETWAFYPTMMSPSIFNHNRCWFEILESLHCIVNVI